MLGTLRKNLLQTNKLSVLCSQYWHRQRQDDVHFAALSTALMVLFHLQLCRDYRDKINIGTYTKVSFMWSRHKGEIEDWKIVFSIRTQFIQKKLLITYKKLCTNPLAWGDSAQSTYCLRPCFVTFFTTIGGQPRGYSVYFGYWGRAAQTVCTFSRLLV